MHDVQIVVPVKRPTPNLHIVHNKSCTNLVLSLIEFIC
jgi:hypothetical protein